MKPPITGIVLTLNEEMNIEACLESMRTVVEEIHIVDSGSNDRTLEIARRFGCAVALHPFESYAEQRNWAQYNLPIRTEWVFHIDADERVTAELAAALQVFYESPLPSQTAGLLVRRKVEFMGRYITHGGIYPTYHCRVFKRDRGHCEKREYDQHFIVNGPLYRIKADLIERTASSLATWTVRHNRWAQMEAAQLTRSGAKSSSELVQPELLGSPINRRRWWRSAVYERSPIFVRAFLYFFYRYFVRCGFLDGAKGLIYHVLQGFWFRFYVDACLYERRNTQK